MNDRLEFAVLGSRGEIEAARTRLVERGLVSSATGRDRVRALAMRAARREDLRTLGRPDPLKSWDVLRSVEAIEATLDPDDAVLDVGSFASAIPPVLTRLGFRRLSGVDLDPRVAELETGGAVDYVVGDLTNTDWPDDRFAAVTAISVIEHGVPQDALLSELSRLLRPGGVFIFSTDFWPDKIDTSDTQLFGLPWTIFSAADMMAFVARARGYGLVPVEDPAPQLGKGSDRPIDFAGRRYTFLHGALIKEPAPR